jgi:hypothetical protein
MTMRKELLVNFTELCHLSIGCRRCHTRILLDCEDREARIPQECPACGWEYESSFRATLQSFREVYRKLADPDSQRVQFHVRRDPDAEEK